MENPVEETPTIKTPEPIPAPIPPVSKSDKTFSMLGKVVVVLVVAAILGFSGYYLGTRSMKNKQPSQNQHVATPASDTPTNMLTNTPTITMPATSTATPTPGGKKVSGGTTNQLFSAFTITIPSGWVDTHTTNTASDTLTITKQQYSLVISQSAGGAGSCDFPGDTPEPMAQVFTTFVGITGTTAQLRRGTTDSMNYTVCEHKANGYAFPTSFGYITYKTPNQPDPAILAEMDGMVASLTK